MRKGRKERKKERKHSCLEVIGSFLLPPSDPSSILALSSSLPSSFLKQAMDEKKGVLSEAAKVAKPEGREGRNGLGGGRGERRGGLLIGKSSMQRIIFCQFWLR